MLYLNFINFQWDDQDAIAKFKGKKIFDRRAFLLGCFTLSYTFWALSKPHKCQSLNCAQRKLGGPIKKSSTYKPSPRHILTGHTKVAIFEYYILACWDFNHKKALDNY